MFWKYVGRYCHKRGISALYRILFFSWFSSNLTRAFISTQNNGTKTNCGNDKFTSCMRKGTFENFGCHKKKKKNGSTNLFWNMCTYYEKTRAKVPVGFCGFI